MELENLTSVKPAPDYEYFFNVRCCLQRTGQLPLSCPLADTTGDLHLVS